jgi:prepilin-type processing-associated H-X9-DG protein
MKRQARGLTLVEMLVILGVVLLLGVLFWPCCICTPREKARRTACLSNLKQIGQAASLYIQDYDGMLPWNPAPGGLPASHWAPHFRASDCAPEPRTSFVALLEPYIASTHAADRFHCPTYPGYPASRHLGYAKSLGKAIANTIGYGFNERLIGSPCQPRSLASLKANAAAVVLFAEADQPWAGSPRTWVQKDGTWTHYWSVDPAQPERHGEGQNFAFADGHARFLRPVIRSSAGGGKPPRSGYYPNARVE